MIAGTTTQNNPPDDTLPETGRNTLIREYHVNPPHEEYYKAPP